MNTLWTFGSSLADPRDYRQSDNIMTEQWLNQVAEQLNYKHQPFGLAGSSHDYMYKKFYDVKDDIQDNDVIIVAMTVMYGRTWFIEDKPNVSTIHSNQLTADEKNAYKQYLAYLDKNPSIAIVHLCNFFESVNRIAKNKNVKTIVFYPTYEEMNAIDSFKHNMPDIYFVHDHFMNVIAGEVNDEYNIFEIAKIDKRYNHMCKSNHIILANKIVNYLKYGNNITLTDIIKNVVNKDFFNNEEKQLYELFGMTWKI